MSTTYGTSINPADDEEREEPESFRVIDFGLPLFLVIVCTFISIKAANSNPTLFFADLFGTLASSRNRVRSMGPSRIITNYAESELGDIYYATLSNSDLNQTLRDNQDEWLKLPEGWLLAPRTEEALRIIRGNYWGTGCLITSDGIGWRTKTATLDWWVVDKNASFKDQLLIKDEVSIQDMGIRSRRPSSSPTSSPTRPTYNPTTHPSKSHAPTFAPSTIPSALPTTSRPSKYPTPTPTVLPTPSPIAHSSGTNLYSVANSGMLVEQIMILRCPPGTRYNAKATGKQSPCSKCRSNTFSKDYGSLSCIPCPRGSLSPEGAFICSSSLPFYTAFDTMLLTAPPRNPKYVRYPYPNGPLIGNINFPSTYYISMDVYLSGIQTATTVLLQGVSNSSCWFADSNPCQEAIPRLSIVPDTLQLEVDLSQMNRRVDGRLFDVQNPAMESSISPTTFPTATPIRALSQPLRPHLWSTITVSVTEDVVTIVVTDSANGEMVIKPLALDWRSEQELMGVQLYSGVDPSSNTISPSSGKIRNIFICKSWDSCVCPAGSYRSAFTLKCLPCREGSYSEASNTATECNLCPLNFEAPQAGSANCMPCSEGKISLNEGSSSCVCPDGYRQSPSTCTLCPINTFRLAQMAEDCEPCPRHSVSGAGSKACVCKHSFKKSDAGCIQCSVGKYAVNASAFSSVRNETCISCRAGTMGVFSKSSHEPICIACRTNFFSLAGDANCTRCPQFSESKDGISCQCKEGYINPTFSKMCYSTSLIIGILTSISVLIVVMGIFFVYPLLSGASHYQILHSDDNGDSKSQGSDLVAIALELKSRPENVVTLTRP